jgi:hypothetical protein
MEQLGKRIDEVSNQLVQLRKEIWVKYTLFTWQWWMFAAIFSALVACAALPLMKLAKIYLVKT